MSDVLIVDDEPNVRVYFPLSLSASGFTCRTAASREQALAAAEAQWPDVVLLDLSLTEAEAKDGWQVWDDLAARAEGRELRVILLSGELLDDDQTEARRRGAVGALSKTTRVGNLVAAIRRALGRKADRGPE